MDSQIPNLNISTVTAFIAMYSNSESAKLKFLKKNDPSYSHLDWVTAEHWKTVLGAEVSSFDFKIICREFCLRFVISNNVMLQLAGNGREALISNLSADELQVFRNGQLLEKLPSQEVVQWWDYLKLLSKGNLNEKLLKQGRLAESWTIIEEKKLLASFTELLPEMISLDGDRYGYDIHSYRLTNFGTITPVQIEVKSYSKKSHPHFYLTQNEWDKAVKAKASFIYYIWCIETEKYVLLTVDDIAPHIPDNKGSGNWQTVLVEYDFQ